MTAPRGAPVDHAGRAPLAYFWGDDAWSIERAIRDLATQLADGGEALTTWRAGEEDGSGESGGEASIARRRTRLLEEAEVRVGGGTLFGGGTLVVIRQPGWIARESAGRTRLSGLIARVAPGNALCFAELSGADGKEPAATSDLRAAIAAADGTVRRFPGIGRERLPSWLEERARELGIALGPGAAALLAERVGANVRENDIDRRHQTEVAVAELGKLALFRPDGTVTREDVAALVPEAIPGSTWALLDAIGDRRATEAATHAERLLAEGVAIPLLVAQLHRRIRDLVIVRDLLDARARPPEIMAALRVNQPYRAQRLAEQAAAWTAAELAGALTGLVELDLRSKGLDPAGGTVTVSDARDGLAVARFLAEHVARPRRR